MTNKLPPHPMQPLVQDAFGTVRFRENKIVNFLLDNGPWDLNKLSIMDWPDGDYTHFMQLIGYSVSGYGELSTSPPALVQVADERAAALLRGVQEAETDPVEALRKELRERFEEVIDEVVESFAARLTHNKLEAS